MMKTLLSLCVVVLLCACGGGGDSVEEEHNPGICGQHREHCV